MSPTDSRWARGAARARRVADPAGRWSPRRASSPSACRSSSRCSTRCSSRSPGRWRSSPSGSSTVAGWALGIAPVNVVLDDRRSSATATARPHRDRGAASTSASALAVELAGRCAGTARRVRFAVVGRPRRRHPRAGRRVGLEPAGLPAVEHQPAARRAVLCLVVGVGAALLGAAFASAVGRRPAAARRARTPGGRRGRRRRRRPGAAAARVRPATSPPPSRWSPRGPDAAVVEVTLTPADAADDARWFQTIVLAGRRARASPRWKSSGPAGSAATSHCP